MSLHQHLVRRMCTRAPALRCSRASERGMCPLASSPVSYILRGSVRESPAFRPHELERPDFHLHVLHQLEPAPLWWDLKALPLCCPESPSQRSASTPPKTLQAALIMIERANLKMSIKPLPLASSVQSLSYRAGSPVMSCSRSL